jgi:predicted lipoprotein with Yx(FWY)xxD motif
MTKTWRPSGVVALVLAAATALSLFAVACGDDDDNGGPSAPVATQPAPGATTDAEPTEEATQPAAGISATIATRDAGALGTILTTSDGYTLYTFDSDVAGSGTSACDASCAGNWPPFPVADPTASTELPGELGSITREDGSPQATYEGKPLYMFSGDAAPGDTNGDGVGGVWHVVTP